MWERMTVKGTIRPASPFVTIGVVISWTLCSSPGSYAAQVAMVNDKTQGSEILSVHRHHDQTGSNPFYSFDHTQPHAVSGAFTVLKSHSKGHRAFWENTPAKLHIFVDKQKQRRKQQPTFGERRPKPRHSIWKRQAPDTPSARVAERIADNSSRAFEVINDTPQTSGMLMNLSSNMAEVLENFTETSSNGSQTTPPVEYGQDEDGSPSRRIWEYGILDKRTAGSILQVLHATYVAFSIISVGVAIVAVIIFQDRRMKSRVVLLITAFNVTEGLKGLTFAVNRVWRTHVMKTPVTWASPYAYFFIYYVSWAPDSVGRVSLLLNLVIAIDRFVVLAFPLQSINRKVVVYPKLTIAGIVTSMLAFQLVNPGLYVTQVMPKLNYSRKFMVSEIIAETFNAAPEASSIYRILAIVAPICFRYIPLTVTIVLNLLTIYFLVYHSKSPMDKDELSSSTTPATPTTANSTTGTAIETVKTKSQGRKRQNNVMIVGSTLIFSFLVSVKPLYRLINLLHPTLGDGKRDLYLSTVIAECALFLDVISPTVTFLSYCKLSSAFRLILLSIFSKKPQTKSPRMTISI